MGVRYEWCSQFRNKQINISYSSMERVPELIVLHHSDSATKQRPMKCIACHVECENSANSARFIYLTLWIHHCSSMVHIVFIVSSLLCLHAELYRSHDEFLHPLVKSTWSINHILKMCCRVNWACAHQNWYSIPLHYSWRFARFPSRCHCWRYALMHLTDDGLISFFFRFPSNFIRF